MRASASDRQAIILRYVCSGQRITYVSHQGYLGNDHFVFAREGKDRFNQPATWTIEVNVEVKERL